MLDHNNFIIALHIEEIYNEWIEGKLQREEISRATKNRYDRQYRESMTEFGKRRIKSIDECDIEDFVLQAINEHSLTQKGYSNLRTLIYGIFKRAKKRKLVDFSITEVISYIEISCKISVKIINQMKSSCLQRRKHQK